MSKHTSWMRGNRPISSSRRATRWILQSFFLRQLARRGSDAVDRLGSNLLSRDGGVRGVVVGAAWCARDPRGASRHTRIQAQARGALPLIARQCVKWGCGRQILCRIPGHWSSPCDERRVLDGESPAAGAWVDVDRSPVGTRHVRTPRRLARSISPLAADAQTNVHTPRAREFEPTRAAPMPPSATAGEASSNAAPSAEWSCGSVGSRNRRDSTQPADPKARAEGLPHRYSSVSPEARNFIIITSRRCRRHRALILHVQRAVADLLWSGPSRRRRKLATVWAA